MKTIIAVFCSVLVITGLTKNLFSQSDQEMKEFGITAGGFTNFPANKDYLKKYMSAIYVAPYIRTGKHEFSAGIVYPLKTDALFYNGTYPEEKLNSCVGAIAGYKFYVFDVYGRENLVIHYAFEYLRFKGDRYPQVATLFNSFTENDMYINNVIGLGYNLFFDTEGRFGLYYTLDYVISQAGYHTSGMYPGISNPYWNTKYIWNNLSTHIGLSFKITSLKKKVVK